METEKPTLVIADMHEIIREGIADKLTTADCAEVVGLANDGYSTINLCRKLQPEILLMDLSLTRPSGMDTFRKLRASLPEMKTVIFSSDNDMAVQAYTMMSLGAVGFVPKQAKGIHFVNAVKAANLGYSSIPVDYLRAFTSLKRTASRYGNLYGLSPREIEVLEACACGARNKDVAEKLDISVRTVETHRNSIYRKTSCNNVSDLKSVFEQL